MPATHNESFFPNSLAVLGPGLIGGSVLKGARRFLPKTELRVWGRRKEALQEIEDSDLADVVSGDIDQVIAGVDLAILAMPVEYMKATVELIADLDGVLVTDVGSVKGYIEKAVAPVVEELGGTFVGSHPMAGSEKTGWAYAKADLFQNAPVIVTGGSENAAAVERIEGFWTKLGAKVSKMNAAEHDETVAAISHLPHVVSAALMRCVGTKNPDAISYAAGGFRDTTRIASGDPEMWAGILTHNRSAVLDQCQKMIAELEEWKTALSSEAGSEDLIAFLRQASQSREESGLTL